MITDQQRAELKAKIEALSDAHAEFRRLSFKAIEQGENRDIEAASIAANRARELRRDLYRWIDREL